MVERTSSMASTMTEDEVVKEQGEVIQAEPVVDDEESPKEEEKDEDVAARAKAAGVLDHPIDAERNPCHCPDALFGIAWGMCFMATIFVSFEYGWTEMSEAEYDDDDDKKKEAVGNLGKVLICQFLVALAIALFLQHIVFRIGKYAIHTSMILTEIVLVGSAAFAAEFAYWYLALILVFLALVAILYQANSLHEIDNASATLEVACDYVSSDGYLQGLHFLGSFVGTLMIFVPAFAGFALYHYKSSKKNTNDATLFASLLILFVIFYWTARLLKYVVVSVVAGTIRWWWYDEDPPVALRPPRAAHPAVVAFFRTWMFNVGPIAFGAIFVDFFDMCMGLLRRTRQWAERYPDGLCASCLVSCCACSLGACQSGCDLVSPYAFVFVGIHGYSFLYAGKQVLSVFHKMGRQASETEIFIDYVMFWLSVSIGLAVAIFGLYMVINLDPELSAGTNKAQVIVFFIGFFGGTSVASLVFGILTGANKTVALLFSDTPRVLALSHPDEFATLATVWQFGSAALSSGNAAGGYGTMGDD